MSPVAPRELLFVGALTMGVRALALVAYLLASSRTSILGYTGTVPVGEGQSRAERLREIDGNLLERLAPYDGQFYLDIARRGYRQYEEWPGGNWAFLPLYPALLYALGGATQGSLLAAVILQVVLAGFAAAALFVLAKRVGAPPWGTVALYLAWPTSVFQVVAYPESLFLTLSLAATLLRLEAYERSAAVAGFLAGLTRPQGVLVSFLLLPRGLWAQRPARALRALLRAKRRGLRPSDALPLAPLFGYLGYVLLAGLAVGSPTAAFEIQGNWGRKVGLSGIFRAAGEILSFRGFRPDLAAAALGLGLLPAFFRLLPLPLALYGTGSVLLPLATGTTTSMGRFLSVAFPVFLAMNAALRRRPRVFAALVLFLAALQVWFLRRLSAWEFVG